MLIFSRSEPDDAYKKNAYKKKRVLKLEGSSYGIRPSMYTFFFYKNNVYKNGKSKNMKN